MFESVRSLPVWALATGYVAIWMLVGVLVRTALRKVLSRIADRHPLPHNEVLAASLPRPAGIAVFLVAMQFSLRWLPLAPEVAQSARRYYPIGLGLLAIIVLVRIALRAIESYGRLNADLESSAGIGRAVTLIAGIVGAALFVSDALDISLAPALTALGIGSLSVALALQDTLSNFFAGLYILADKPVRRGSFVQLDPSHEGYVEAIGWRSTHLRTLTGDLVIVPNSVLSKAVITNFNGANPRLAIEIKIELALEADIDKAELALSEETARAARELEGLVTEPAPFVRFAPGFVDKGLAFTVYARAVSVDALGKAQHDLRMRLCNRLKRESIPLRAL